MEEKLRKTAVQRRDGGRDRSQNKHDPTVKSWSRRAGTALGGAVLGLVLLPSREAGELSQANWLLQEVTSRSLPECWKEKAALTLLRLPQLRGEMPGSPGRAGSQADAPLLLRLEDMSSRLKDISTRQRGCGGRGNTQQEGTGTGHMRDERRSQFMLKCKYGSGMLLRRDGRACISPGRCAEVRKRRVRDCCSSPVPPLLLPLSAARYHESHVRWQRDGVSAIP
ncbi:uncharacterized protein M6G45_006625 isoform 1-T1 [Spheniscus humboldti]